ncbi:glycerophosphodiester phosphodiesterase family protein [Sporosarcina thermotolerans]|uniref:Glycerophosphodiester phosphodiesterase family protein n=1 Tax=Sporosarcina thermotolerans TaxID=633404 RepID=A0AAW9A7D9_9BACL|nr:glycerophosphodiester phosphodiesterase family protein [Sporosarcina thermotolerans]MDW0117302.1 glycerophosphodiester phosphodiesterase family protein [Sporosarcina thermotolerans]WHT47456.1 glycerophosphodiester phosphodiesterase family protein [Sporosarcina thermotolerans]
MSIESPNYKPLVFAHRGASGVCFENTMSAFKEALRQGADGIELDVQLTADGIPVVVHDKDLSRVAGIRKPISSLSLSELKGIKVGRKFIRNFAGHEIPTLSEVVSFCALNHLALNIELKETVSERPEYLRDILNMALLLDQVHISSFDAGILERVKMMESSLEIAFLVKKKTTDWDDLGKYHFADGFHLSKSLMQEPYLSKMVDSGKILRVYGVTGKEENIRNPAPSITGWITDYPGRFK